jgi:hypothetical protein
MLLLLLKYVAHAQEPELVCMPASKGTISLLLDTYPCQCTTRIPCSKAYKACACSDVKCQRLSRQQREITMKQGEVQEHTPLLRQHRYGLISCSAEALKDTPLTTGSDGPIVCQKQPNGVPALDL